MEDQVRGRLAEALRIRGRSQRWLSINAHVSQASVSAYLNGVHKRLALEVWIRIAKALDISLDWLAGLPPREAAILSVEEEELLRLWRTIRSDLIKSTTLSTLRAAVSLEQMDDPVSS